MKIKINYTQAAVLFNIKKPLRILKLKLPNHLEKNQVLIKNLYSGICGTQLAEFNGLKKNKKFLPHLMGHESLGVVVQKNKNVRKVKVGDKVVTHWMNSKGKNSVNPKYFYNKKSINSGLITTFSRHSVISQNKLTKIPKINIDNKTLPLFGCSLSTAYGSFLNLKKIKKNKIIAISGMGPIGINILQISKISKPKKIIVIDINKSKLNFSKKFGDIETLKFSNRSDFLKNINKLSQKKGIDYFFECSGNIRMIEMAFDTIKTKGTLFIIGNSKIGNKIKVDPFDFIKGKNIIGSFGGNFNPDKDIKKFYEIIKRNRINIKKQITNIIKLDQINKVFNLMNNSKTLGKTLIKF